MEVISNNQDALVLAVGPQGSIIGWSAVASKGDLLRLHPSRNPPVSLVISIGRQSGKKIAKFGGTLSQEIRCRSARRHPVKTIAAARTCRSMADFCCTCSRRLLAIPELSVAAPEGRLLAESGPLRSRSQRSYWSSIVSAISTRSPADVNDANSNRYCGLLARQVTPRPQAEDVQRDNRTACFGPTGHSSSVGPLRGRHHACKGTCPVSCARTTSFLEGDRREFRICPNDDVIWTLQRWRRRYNPNETLATGSALYVCVGSTRQPNTALGDSVLMRSLWARLSATRANTAGENVPFCFSDAARAILDGPLTPN